MPVSLPIVPTRSPPLKKSRTTTKWLAPLEMPSATTNSGASAPRLPTPSVRSARLPHPNSSSTRSILQTSPGCAIASSLLSATLRTIPPSRPNSPKSPRPTVPIALARLPYRHSAGSKPPMPSRLWEPRSPAILRTAISGMPRFARLARSATTRLCRFSNNGRHPASPFRPAPPQFAVWPAWRKTIRTSPSKLLATSANPISRFAWRRSSLSGAAVMPLPCLPSRHCSRVTTSASRWFP